MGWIAGIIFDWLAVDGLDRAARRLPPWAAAALLVLPVAALIVLLWLFVR